MPPLRWRYRLFTHRVSDITPWLGSWPPRGTVAVLLTTPDLRMTSRSPAPYGHVHTRAYPGIFGRTCALFRGITGAFRDAHR